MSILKERTSSKTSGITKSFGKIRPGRKVPTKATRAAAAANPRIQAVVDQYERNEISSSLAEKMLLDIDGNLKFAFSPKNLPYFSVGPGDFTSPTLGDVVPELLLRLYGEDRDGTGNHLWRIPVVFSDCDIEKVFPSQFRVAKAAKNGIAYESMYINGERHCMFRAEVQNTGAKRLKMLPRPLKSRGLCDPEVCPEFGNNACKFGGTLKFHIPGVSGIDPFAMTTSSTYAAEDIYSQLETVIEKLGYLPREQPDGKPVFYLVKSQKQRTYYDEAGGKKSGLVWVPDIIADIDFTKVLAIADERSRSAIANANVPHAWLQQSSGAVAGTQGETAQPPVQEKSSAVVLPMAENVPSILPTEKTGNVVDITVKDKDQQPSDGQGLTLIEQFDEKASFNSVLVAEWANGKFGAGWRDKSEAVSEALGILQRLLVGGEDITVSILEYKVLIYKTGLNQELTEQFISMKFGAKFFKSITTLGNAKQTIEKLLESGKDVAEIYMQSELAKAA